MKFTKKQLILIGFSLVLIGQQSLIASGSESAAEGARLYNENCARCHNPRAVQEFTEENWSVIMPHMRERAHLTGGESRAIENFIAVTLTAEKARGLVESSDHLAVPDLIAKFACKGCHQLNNEGGNIGPALDGISDRRDKSYITRKLLEPTFDNRASAMPRFPLTESDAARIAEYLGEQ